MLRWTFLYTASCPNIQDSTGLCIDMNKASKSVAFGFLKASLKVSGRHHIEVCSLAPLHSDQMSPQSQCPAFIKPRLTSWPEKRAGSLPLLQSLKNLGEELPQAQYDDWQTRSLREPLWARQHPCSLENRSPPRDCKYIRGQFRSQPGPLNQFNSPPPHSPALGHLGLCPCWLRSSA